MSLRANLPLSTSFATGYSPAQPGCVGRQAAAAARPRPASAAAPWRKWSVWLAPAVAAAGARPVGAIPGFFGPLPQPNYACVQVRSPSGGVVDLWSNDTAPGGSANVDTTELVRALVRTCEATARQHSVDCGTLLGAQPLLRAANRTLQAVVFADPRGGNVEPDFLRCTEPLLASFVAQRSASNQGVRRDAVLSQAAMVGVFVGVLASLLVLAAWSVHCFVARRRDVARSRALLQARADFVVRDAERSGECELVQVPPRYPGQADDYTFAHTEVQRVRAEFRQEGAAARATPPPPYG